MNYFNNKVQVSFFKAPIPTSPCQEGVWVVAHKVLHSVQQMQTA
jgi:hypothetical protein